MGWLWGLEVFLLAFKDVSLIKANKKVPKVLGGELSWLFSLFLICFDGFGAFVLFFCVLTKGKLATKETRGAGCMPGGQRVDFPMFLVTPFCATFWGELIILKLFWRVDFLVSPIPQESQEDSTEAEPAKPAKAKSRGLFEMPASQVGVKRRYLKTVRFG